MTTTTEEKPRIEPPKSAVQILTKQRDDQAETIKELRAKIDALEAEAGVCCCECGDFDECFEKARYYEDRIGELAQIYTAMAGNPKAARERLALVLDQIDNCWRQFA